MRIAVKYNPQVHKPSADQMPSALIQDQTTTES